VRLSITARLVAMFAVATLAGFAAIGVVIYGVLEHELLRHQTEELQTNLQLLEYSIERTGTPERWGRVQAKMDTLTPPDGRVRFWVLSDDPRFQYGKDLPALQDLGRVAEGSSELRLAGARQPMRTLSRDILPLLDRPAVRLIVGSDSTPYVRTLRVFVVTMASLAVASLLAVVVVGTSIARVGLQPLKRLSIEASALRPRAHAQGLQVSRLPEELADFAVAFNGALARQEDTYRQLEAFNADVAHELRTPLANLIGGTQVALSRPRNVRELEEILHSNLEELEELRLIINDMLFLARADQGEVATGRVRTRIADEVEKTIEFYEVLLEELGASIAITGDVDAQAPIEPALVRRALSNLVQNAIEHSRPGARISVEIRRDDGEVWVCVANPGEPIDEQHVKRLFDRFYRVDAARSLPGRPHGHGLGLAIVKAVATMHAGRVSATSRDGVTTIGFCVPAARMAAPASAAARAEDATV
jgi:two-component system, OmpR family, heavy metal sensor histidine kinase CusS